MPSPAILTTEQIALVEQHVRMTDHPHAGHVWRPAYSDAQVQPDGSIAVWSAESGELSYLPLTAAQVLEAFDLENE